MRSKWLRATYGLTINAGQYSNERVEFVLEVQLEALEEEGPAAEAAATLVRHWCRQALQQSPVAMVRTHPLVQGEREADDTPF